MQADRFVRWSRGVFPSRPAPRRRLRIPSVSRRQVSEPEPSCADLGGFGLRFRRLGVGADGRLLRSPPGSIPGL